MFRRMFKNISLSSSASHQTDLSSSSQTWKLMYFLTVNSQQEFLHLIPMDKYCLYNLMLSTYCACQFQREKLGCLSQREIILENKVASDMSSRCIISVHIMWEMIFLFKLNRHPGKWVPWLKWVSWFPWVPSQEVRVNLTSFHKALWLFLASE